MLTTEPVSPPVPPRGRIPLGVHRRVPAAERRELNAIFAPTAQLGESETCGAPAAPAGAARPAATKPRPRREELSSSGRGASGLCHCPPAHSRPHTSAPCDCGYELQPADSPAGRRIQAVASGSPALHPLPHDSRTPNESAIRTRPGSSPGGLRVVIQALPEGDYRMARNASGNGRTTLENTGTGSHKCFDPPAQKEMRPCPRQTEDGSSSRVSLDIRVSRMSGLLVGANSRVAATAAGARVAKQETNIVPGATARSSVALQSYAARKSALVQPCRPDSSSWSLDTRCRCLADSRKGSMCRSNSLICRHSPQAPFPRRKRRRNG